MGKNLTRKILEAHAVEGEWRPGDTLAIRVDQVLTLFPSLKSSASAPLLELFDGLRPS